MMACLRDDKLLTNQNKITHKSPGSFI